MADLGSMVPAALAAVEHAQADSPNARVLLVGSSLGAAVALAVAAELCSRSDHSLAGLILRDPPQLYDVIMQRFGWWTGWWPAWMVARRTPDALDCYRLVTHCTVPAVIVSSMLDTIVPPAIHQKIYENYAGPKRIVLSSNESLATSERNRVAGILRTTRLAERRPSKRRKISIAAN